MKKKTKWILFGGGMAAAAAAGAYGAARSIAKQLLSIAVDRQEPEILRKGKEKLTGSPDMAEVLRLSDSAAQTLEHCGCRDVEIVSRDGIRLAGHLYECANAERIVIAMHGWRSSWSKDFGVISQFLHSHNCSVLYAEQRGQNRSEGDFMSFGLLERYDCLDWINWVNEQSGSSLPVYLVGLSMGATTVLMTAGFELPRNVRGIIADCGFTSPHAIWKHVVEHNLHLPYALHDTFVEKQLKKKINLGSQDYSTVETLQSCSVPVLFIHGTDDHFVPVSMTYENYRACAAPKQLLIVPGAEHGLSYLVEQKKYEETVRSFWSRCEGTSDLL